MILFVLRGLVFVIITAISVLYLLTNQEQGGFTYGQFLTMLGVTLGLAALVIAADALTPKKKLSAISGVFIGLMVGLVVLLPLAYVVDLVGLLNRPADPPQELVLEQAIEDAASAIELLDLPPEQRAQQAFDQARVAMDRNAAEIDEAVAAIQTQENLLLGIKILLGVITCYFCISLVLQTKDDFRFIIPYVEFAKQVRGNRPVILDTSVIIDGRILDITETQIMQGVIIVPRFVLDELQLVADSTEKIKRSRGRRGLEILQKLQTSASVEVHIEEREAEGINVDQKLIDLAQQMQGRVMTNDFNLNKLASLRGVDVININDLAKALRPVVLPGEHMTVKLVKPGESPTQGVGYLEDGTMVVVEDGRSHLDHDVDLVVTSTLQTSAGRMIFGKFAREEDKATPGLSSERSAQAQSAARQSEAPKPGAGPSRRNPRRG